MLKVQALLVHIFGLEMVLLNLECDDILAGRTFSTLGILIILSKDFVEHLSDATKGKVQVMINIMSGMNV